LPVTDDGRFHLPSPLSGIAVRSLNSPRLTVYDEPQRDLTPTAFSHLAVCESLCKAFSQATGSVLTFEPSTAHSSPVDASSLWSATVGSSQDAVRMQLLAKETTCNAQQCAAHVELAEKISDVLDEYFKARITAEQLASEIGVKQLQPSRKRIGNLEQDLQHVLQTMVQTLACTAAGMYVLDDATSVLQLRTMWGLPIDSLIAEPRNLETARADLEAMLGHAVVLSNKQMFELWQVPEIDFESAVCVPLATATTVLGTVWIFHTHPRPFSDPEVNLIEVLTGRLAIELESAACKIAEPISG